MSIIVISHCLPECPLVSGNFPLSTVGNEAEGNDCLGSSWWKEWPNSDCQTAVRTMAIPAAWFPMPAFIHLLKSLYFMQSWNSELISPKTQQKSLMTVICLSSESSWFGNQPSQIVYSMCKWEIALFSSHINSQFNLKRFSAPRVTVRKFTEKSSFVLCKLKWIIRASLKYHYVQFSLKLRT